MSLSCFKCGKKKKNCNGFSIKYKSTLLINKLHRIINKILFLIILDFSTQLPFSQLFIKTQPIKTVY